MIGRHDLTGREASGDGIDDVPIARPPDLAARRGVPFTPSHWISDRGAELSHEIPVMLVDRWAFTHHAWENGDAPFIVSTENGWRTVDGDRIEARVYDARWEPRHMPAPPAWRPPYPHENEDCGPFVETHQMARNGTQAGALMAFGDLAYTQEAWALGQAPSYAFHFESGDVSLREWPDGVPLDPSYTVVPVMDKVQHYAGWRDQSGRPHIAIVDVSGVIRIADLEWAGRAARNEAAALQLAVLLLDGTSPDHTGDARVRRAVVARLSATLPPVGPWTLPGKQVALWAREAADMPEIRPPLDRANFPFVPTHRMEMSLLGEREVMVWGRTAVTRQMWEGGNGVELRRDVDGLWHLITPNVEIPAFRELHALPSRYLGYTNADGVQHVVRVVDGDLREVLRATGAPAGWSMEDGRRAVAAEMSADALLGVGHSHEIGDGRLLVGSLESWLAGLAVVTEDAWELSVLALQTWARTPQASLVAALHADVPRAPLIPRGPSAPPSTPPSPEAEPPFLPPAGV